MRIFGRSSSLIALRLFQLSGRQTAQAFTPHLVSIRQASFLSFLPGSIFSPDLLGGVKRTVFRMFWDQRYSSKDFAYGTEPNDFLKEITPSLNIPSKGRCLMLADGEGRNGVFMAQQGYDVVSVDFSQVGLDKAQALAKECGVELETKLADLGEFDFGTEQWDCIVGIFSHLPPPIRAKVHAAIPGSLKEGGVLVFEMYTPAQLEYKTGGPPVVEMMYSKDMLETDFAGLKIERNEEVVRDVVEGSCHTGKGAVVQFIGRK